MTCFVWCTRPCYHNKRSLRPIIFEIARPRVPNRVVKRSERTTHNACGCMSSALPISAAERPAGIIMMTHIIDGTRTRVPAVASSIRPLGSGIGHLCLPSSLASSHRLFVVGHRPRIPGLSSPVPGVVQVHIAYVRCACMRFAFRKSLVHLHGDRQLAQLQQAHHRMRAFVAVKRLCNLFNGLLKIIASS